MKTLLRARRSAGSRRVTGSGAAGRAAPSAPGPTKRRSRPTWKRLALAALAAFVVLTVGRSLLPALGIGSPSADGGRPTPATPLAKAPKAPTVDLNGVMVQGGGAPMITLDPGLVRLGAAVTVTGSGFDAGSSVDVLLSPQEQPAAAGASGKAGATGKRARPSAGAGRPVKVATAVAGKNGAVRAGFTFPSKSGAATYEVTAQQRSGDKVAKADAAVAQGAGQAVLSATTGKPGDTVSLTVKGFAPGETLNVYWGRINGDPALTLEADESGAVGRTPIRVGVTAVGVSSLIVVGQTSGSAASVPLQVLRLYPSIKLAPYAVKATQRIGFSGTGFAPGERVLVRLNSAGGQPVLALQTDESGAFKDGGLVMPYALTGAQSLVFVGEQSRASISTGFTILPYTPQARANAYGGLPGTVLNFYASAFAPNEAVHVYAKLSKGAKGELVSAFRVDQKGAARAVGQYTIPGTTDDTVVFELKGQLSNATATVNFKVDKSGGPVELPSPSPYTLPKELEK